MIRKGDLPLSPFHTKSIALTMDISTQILALKEEFEAHPGDFLVEAELQFALKRILQDQLQIGPTSLGETCYEGTEESYTDGPDHTAYADQIRHTEHFEPVHCEVNVAGYGQGGNTLLDLAVFGANPKMTLREGTKEFYPEDLETAVELKFVKNTKYLQDGLQGRIREDVDRLKTLGDAVDDVYCLLFSNFGLLRKHGHEEAFRELRREAEPVVLMYADPIPSAW